MPPNNVRLLITGGGSYLGRHLVPMAAATHELVYTYFRHHPPQLPPGQQLDVRDATAVTHLVTSLQPHIIIHTVGSNRGHDVENTIILGTQNITRAAATVGARLIHLSTDSIFRGNAPPYDETARPDPVNAYGRAKAEAEAMVQAIPNTVIIRTSLIYGLNVMDHGTAWMAQALRAGQPVTLFDNQIRNPVWVETLSRACLELAQNNYTGILNVAGRQTLSRAAFSLKMLDYWGITSRTTLTVGAASDGEWPLNCELDLHRAAAVLRTPLYGIDDVLTMAGSP